MWRTPSVVRADRAAMAVHGIRSNVENWFSWLKATLRRGDRAASIDINHQLLDVFAATLLDNAVTYRTSHYGTD